MAESTKQNESGNLPSFDRIFEEDLNDLTESQIQDSVASLETVDYNTYETDDDVPCCSKTIENDKINQANNELPIAVEDIKREPEEENFETIYNENQSKILTFFDQTTNSIELIESVLKQLADIRVISEKERSFVSIYLKNNADLAATNNALEARGFSSASSCSLSEDIISFAKEQIWLNQFYDQQLSEEYIQKIQDEEQKERARIAKQIKNDRELAIMLYKGKKIRCVQIESSSEEEEEDEVHKEHMFKEDIFITRIIDKFPTTKRKFKSFVSDLNLSSENDAANPELSLKKRK